MKTPVKAYTFNNVWAIVILRALDVFWACVIWRDYDITISSWTGIELWKERPAKWALILGWILNHIEKGHCEGAIIADLERIEIARGILERKAL